MELSERVSWNMDREIGGVIISKAVARVLEKAGLPLETLRPFLEELRAKNVESPQLYTTFIDMLEESAKNKKVPLEVTALQVTFPRVHTFDLRISYLIEHLLDVR